MTNYINKINTLLMPPIEYFADALDLFAGAGGRTVETKKSLLSEIWFFIDLSA